MLPKLSKGNRKVKCGIFNLPSVVTCRKGVKCTAVCYARKAERIYPQVLPFRQGNLSASKQADFQQNLYDAIIKVRQSVVRIHEAGDFYNVRYILDWFEVIKALPEVQFYAYTKRHDLFKHSIMQLKPSNLTLIYSFDYGAPIDHHESILGMYDKTACISDYESNCNAQTSGAICMVNCTKCIDDSTKRIIFKKH